MGKCKEDMFDLIENIVCELKKRYRIWKNGCKRCKLFDDCFDYLDGEICFIKEQDKEVK